MFTGIVTDIGEVVTVEGGQFSIRTAYDPATIAIGASIACAGVCLTVVEVCPPLPLGEGGGEGKFSSEGGCIFAVDVSAETLSRTNIGEWKTGTKINLERALKIGDELGGHWVTGHVDGVATILQVEEMRGQQAAHASGPRSGAPMHLQEVNAGSKQITLLAPDALAQFIAEKGSVTLDGVSLTVNAVRGAEFDVNIIPHTWVVTTLGGVQAGDKLHLEIDMIARYLARMIGRK